MGRFTNRQLEVLEQITFNIEMSLDIDEDMAMAMVKITDSDCGMLYSDLKPCRIFSYLKRHNKDLWDKIDSIETKLDCGLFIFITFEK